MHALVPAEIRGLTRAQYDGMVEHGLLGDERVELLYGQIVEISPQNNEHSLCVELLDAALQAGLRGRARVRCQLPFAPDLSDNSEPEVGVVQYWLVNLVDRVVEVHEAPIGGIWSRTERVALDGELVVAAFPDVRFNVRDLLP